MIAALIMVKNEEKSIEITINSIKNYIKHVIVYDTGSTDNTINVIKTTCEKNNQTLHLKNGIFENFAISRNESIKFAESIVNKYNNEQITYLLLLDAGDEFRCNYNKYDLIKILNYNMTNQYIFGIVTKEWLQKSLHLINHVDVRLIKCNKNCRYDEDYPVHETFKNKTSENVILLKDLFVLYQDRSIHGESSKNRMRKDIEMLSKIPNKRNYYHLGQTYIDIEDYENAYKYLLLCYEEKGETNNLKSQNSDDMGNYKVLIKIIICCVNLKKEFDFTLKFIQKAIELEKDNLEAYIYLLNICIQSKQFNKVKPYIETIASLEKKLDSGYINHEFYDYVRWNFMTIICMNLNDFKSAEKYCLLSIKARNDQMDIKNLQIIKNFIQIQSNIKT